MDIKVFKKIVLAAKTMHSGLPYPNTLRSIHAMAVHDLGAERVGDLSLYPSTPSASIWTLELCKLDALQYQTRNIWGTKSPAAYYVARKNGWLDLCCAHMGTKTKPSGYWTLELCQADALLYKTRSDWQAQSSAWSTAQRNGWIDLCCGHMVEKKKSNGYWTLERCKESASKYASRSKWGASDASAYQAAFRRGWVDQCCDHMVEKQKPNGYWTLERCQTAALAYSSKTEWKSSIDSGAFDYAYRNGWLEQCCTHMVPARKPRGYWTLERCQAAALNYSSKTEWEQSGCTSHSFSYRKGWVDMCCDHMRSTKQPHGYWTLERCQSVALKYAGRKEWQQSDDKSALAAAYKNGWIDLCCAHMVEKKKPNGYWTLERCQAAALKYSSKRKWRKSIDSASHASAYAHGWLDLCCGHMIAKHKPAGYWTLDLCKESALKYSGRTEWKKSVDSDAFATAYARGWMNACCGHMILKQKPIGYWTVELCREAALKYSSKAEWRNSKDSNAHAAAKKNKWLDQCCTHMVGESSRGLANGTFLIGA